MIPTNTNTGKKRNFQDLSRPGAKPLQSKSVRDQMFCIVGFGVLMALLFLSSGVQAQPLPPENPYGGNPVPVDGVSTWLIISLMGVALYRKRFRQKKG